MGQLKQLHIDCEPTECRVNQPETCYMLEEVSEAEVEKSRREWILEQYKTSEIKAEAERRGFKVSK